MKFIIGPLAIALGAIFVIKTEWFIQNFGTSAWAEAKFGMNGGTRLMYKLIGIGMIIISFMGMTGMLGDILISTLGGLFGGLQ